MMNNMKQGFTLAEVLITLVIIGVIAAITIPSLMNKTNEQDTVVAVKKAYSILGQAYQRVVAENGEIIPSTLSSNGTEATKAFGDIFAKQLNTQKVCGMSTDEDCFAKSYKFFNGTGDNNYNAASTFYKIRLNDGMSVVFSKHDNSYDRAGDSDPLSHIIVYADVDINGDKGPNTYGKDVFFFYITKYGVVPNGTPDDTASQFSACHTYGYSCTAWVIAKGNVDYVFCVYIFSLKKFL